MLVLEDKLQEISDKCKKYSSVFFTKSIKYKQANTVLNVINITFTTATGIMATYSSTENSSNRLILTYVSAVLVYTSACINSVQQFLNLESISEKGKTTAMRFLTLSNNIQTFLYTDTGIDTAKKDYLKWVLKEYETILSQESLVENTVELNEVQVQEVNTEEIGTPSYQYEIDRFLVNSYHT
jgi:hypothetical protein